MHIRPWDGGLLRQMLRVNEFFTTESQSFRALWDEIVHGKLSSRDILFNGELHWLYSSNLMWSDVAAKQKLSKHRDIILFIIVVSGERLRLGCLCDKHPSDDKSSWEIIDTLKQAS